MDAGTCQDDDEADCAVNCPALPTFTLDDFVASSSPHGASKGTSPKGESAGKKTAATNGAQKHAAQRRLHSIRDTAASTAMTHLDLAAVKQQLDVGNSATLRGIGPWLNVAHLVHPCLLSLACTALVEVPTCIKRLLAPLQFLH